MKRLVSINLGESNFDSISLRKIIKSQGYLYIKKFFSPIDLSVIKKHVFTILETQGWGTIAGDKLEASQSSIYRIGSKKYDV